MNNATKFVNRQRLQYKVPGHTVLPAISTTQTDNTSCDTGNQNGQASANVGGVTAGYTFTWYEGVGTSGPVVDNTAATLAHLKVMTYTVKVVNNATGCSSTAQVSIGNNQVPPVAATATTPMTICSLPANGTASANVGGNITDYTFYWFKGNVNTPNIASPDFTGATYSQLTAGFYTVVAVDNATTCQAASAVVQVMDNTVLPTISTTKTDNTSCDTGNQTGKATANVGGVTAGYTFTWYEGWARADLWLDNTAKTLAHLKVGTYTVKVVNDAAGCSSTAQVSIGNNQVHSGCGYFFYSNDYLQPAFKRYGVGQCRRQHSRLYLLLVQGQCEYPPTLHRLISREQYILSLLRASIPWWRSIMLRPVNRPRLWYR